jgi:Planctomycete cytochrome C
MLAIALLAIASCSKPAVISCGSTVSFTQDIQPIFKSSCALTGCHGNGSSRGGLSLDSAGAYSHLTKSGTGYISVGNPESSILYNSMTSTSNPMPQSGLLTASYTDKVYCWIKQGATNK